MARALLHGGTSSVVALGAGWKVAVAEGPILTLSNQCLGVSAPSGRWAVFGEKLMLDAGYGNNEDEIWLMWMKWNLRTVVNTILDYEIHNADLSREAAISLLTKEAFQQETEAKEKWRRATFTQVQLTSYFNGYAEITALRDDEKKRLGKDFSVKGFNNRFLSYGSAPVRDIRRLMRDL